MNNTHTPIPAETYQWILEVMPICAVDVVFFNKDKTKTLLFKRLNEPLKGKYFSIGGRLLKNEKLEDCAVRQALWEAGVQIQKDRLILGGVQEEIYGTSAFGEISYHAIDIFYGYVLGDEEITLDNQHSDYQWFSVSDDTLHLFIKTKVTSLLKIYGKKF